MIEPKYKVLQSLFSDRVFKIPHYQRFYSWENRQRKELFNDINKLAQSNTDDHHFMATIVCYNTKETKIIGTQEYKTYDIVDGQQRLTTLIILLKCIEEMLPNSNDDEKLTKSELSKILVKPDGNLILLQANNTNEHNLTLFLKEGKIPDKDSTTTHAEKKVVSAINQCFSYIKEWNKNRKISDLMSLVLHKLGFIIYDLEQEKLVYTTFEVLNSRGLAVDWLDKTKSILMGTSYELSSSESVGSALQSLQHIWGNIYKEIACYNIKGDEIISLTATLFYSSVQGKTRNPQQSLDLFKQSLSDANKPAEISDRILTITKKLIKLYSTEHIDPILNIAHAKVLNIALQLAKNIDNQERDKLLKQWEIVTFRIYGLHGRDSRHKVGDYIRLATKIVQEELNTRTYNEIMTEIRKIGKDYPISEALNEGIKNKDFYQNQAECRYLLWEYEKHLQETQGNNATLDVTEQTKIWKLRTEETIEHILPQTPEGTVWLEKLHNEPIEPNVNRIGNLILLPSGINKEAMRRPFKSNTSNQKTKVDVYKKDNLRMIQEVCAKDDWSLTEINEREEKIIQWALIRWDDI